MRFWFFSTGPSHSRRHLRPAPPVHPFLESLEDRCLPSGNPMAASASVAPSPANTMPAAVNSIASLSHDQIHMLQDQSQFQTALATVRLEVEQAVLGILDVFAPHMPQFQPLIAFLNHSIPAQQATVNSLQNQNNLLNQLDDLQDQGIILDVQIQNAATLIPRLQQVGNVPEANALKNLISADQAAVLALQPQITAVEVEVSAFV
jgi:hypothetical protein